MRGVNGAVYSSRGRRLSSVGAAAAPRGGRGTAAAPKGSTSSRGGRGAAIVPRGGNVGSTSTGSGSSTPQPSRDDHVDNEYHPSEEEGEEDEFLQLEVFQFEAKLQEAIEARQRLEQMVQALYSRLDSSTPRAPLPTLSSPGTAGSMIDSTAPDGDAGDGTYVSTPNQDHVDESIVERPLEDNANESTHK